MSSQKYLETTAHTNHNNMKGFGFIYKLVPICDFTEGDIYIGSTTHGLAKRFYDHKNNSANRCTSRILFQKYGVDNIAIELIEQYPCSSKQELAIREGFHQRANPCVNKNIAGRTTAQYRADNRKLINDKQNKFRRENREVVSAHQKAYNNKHAQKIKTYQAKWREANREVTRAKAKAKRAAQAANPVL
jgi:hypothetical protein